ncbi:MAG: class I SAM-dependent methyltransferase [Leptolyngbyaceae bacterium]|nr:class I SAM-dependent methyltransferase [Leptolyngbyaceae bacterium]
MQAQPLVTNHSNQVLCQLIAEQIAEAPHQRITFAEYMEVVLYHPQEGYYATNVVNIGADGDFFTSPHLGADFGELLAEQFVQMWHILGNPIPFTLVEMGAGQGILAGDILRYLHRHHADCFAALEYVIVEKSAGLVAEQQQRLQHFAKIQSTSGQVLLRWSTLEAIAPHSITGCYFSNELVDALPVHQVVIQDGKLQEVYVTTYADSAGNISFAEVVSELSSPQLAEYFDWVGIDLSADIYPEGYRSEVNLAALNWLGTVADQLQRGYILTIDYGYPATRYYSPARREGTLQCYYRHTHHSDPYVHVGRQDLTAHVDFTALERWGDRAGLQQVGFTQQGLFLMALGLGDRLAALSTTNVMGGQGIQELLQRREALHGLMNPMGLGNFGVLVQSKGLTAAENTQPLRGLLAYGTE